MSINLYSTGTVDSLLAAKLSDAPIDGSTYGRKDGAWEVVSGGGGGAAWGGITGTLGDQTDLASALSAKAEISGSSVVSVAGSGGTSYLGTDSGGSISVTDLSATTTTKVTYSGITFSDSSTMTTAPIAGANLGDAFTLGKVQDVSASSGYWVITFAPINAAVAELGISVSLSDGTSAEEVTSSGYSTTTTWTYTTTTLTSSDYIYITVNGQRSTITISQP